MANKIGGVYIETAYKIDMNSFKQVQNSVANISKQTEGLSKGFKALGKVAVAAFSIKAITNFSKQCVNLASDLVEVQNVVDVTFENLAGDINNFAKSSIKDFGLSETAAKQYSSTIGAISKSMGFTTEDALVMGKSMTALAADMASFYNLDTDTAFNKIRSGLTGETEPLKQLGINMSVANLEAYALSQGITKSVSAMTEQEKMLLRNNYLLSVTKDAQGDFIRNQNSWANQTRILSEQFNTLKATLGQIGIKFLLPIITGFNQLFTTIQSSANSLANFLGIATNSDVSITSSAGLGAEAVSGIADSYEEVGKAAKKAKGSVAGFDNVIQLSKPEASGAVGSGGLAGGGDLGVGLASYDFTPKGASSVTGSIKDKINGMFAGIQMPNLSFNSEQIKTDLMNTISNIGNTLKTVGKFTLDIGFKVWNDIDGVGVIESVITTFSKLSNLISTAIATITPGLTEFYDVGIAPIVEWVGTKLKDSLAVVGIEFDKWGKWFSDNKQNFVELGTLLGQVVAGIWSFIEPLANVVWEVFKGAITIISDTFRTFGQWVLDNKEGVVGTFVSLSTALLTYKGIMTGMAIASWIKNYGLLTIAVKALDIQQALLNLTMSLNPIGIVIALIAGLVAAIIYLWNTNEGFRTAIIDIFTNIKETISGVINFIKDGFVNGFTSSLGIVGARLDAWIETVKGVFDGLKKIFGGIIDFIAGVFTGDWERAFGGLKNIVLGIFKGIASIALQPFNTIVNAWNGIAGKIGNYKIPEWVPFVGGKTFALPQIPKPQIALAAGGIVTGRTWTELGEAGPEAVVPLKNDNYTDALAQNVANRVNGENSRNQQPIIQVIFKDNNLFGTDFDDIAKQVKKSFEKENVRFGGVVYDF